MIFIFPPDPRPCVSSHLRWSSWWASLAFKQSLRMWLLTHKARATSEGHQRTYWRSKRTKKGTINARASASLQGRLNLDPRGSQWLNHFHCHSDPPSFWKWGLRVCMLIKHLGAFNMTKIRAFLGYLLWCSELIVLLLHTPEQSSLEKLMTKTSQWA